MQEGLFEEAGLLREREVDMKVRLGGLPHEAPPLPCVTLADVEAVLSAWTGIPPERMGQDDRDRLSLMEPVLKASPFMPAPGRGLQWDKLHNTVPQLSVSAHDGGMGQTPWYTMPQLSAGRMKAEGDSLVSLRI